MTAKTGSAHSRYAGLLPIEPSDDLFCPIDLKAEPIDLKPEPIDLKPEPIDFRPEDVPFPYWQRSAGKGPRSLARVLIAFCTGIAITLLWQSSYGDAVRESIAKLYPQIGWPAARLPKTAENVIAPTAPRAEQPAVRQNIKKIVTTIAAGQEPTTRSTDQMAAGQEPTTRSTDQMATGQEQMMRNTDQTAISVDQAPATRTSNVTAESRPDAASLQPAARLTEERPPQTLSERGKQLSAGSEHDASCFASASAVLQNHPGGWPTWTFRAPGHEGTMCWYAAARPRGSDHRREKMPKEKETVRTAQHELVAPFAPYGRGGWWEGGLP
jgi:hypothetical protein